MDSDGKFENVKDSGVVLRRLNDELCAAHGLSIIKNPKKREKPPGETAAVKYGVSFKERLCQVIDRVLPDCKSYEDFLARMRSEAEEIRVKFEGTSVRIKQLEGRMGQTAQMKTHIINYSKTREVYTAYRKTRNKGKFRAEHRAEIEKHEAAKKAFDALSGKAIPKVAQLTEMDWLLHLLSIQFR